MENDQLDSASCADDVGERRFKGRAAADQGLHINILKLAKRQAVWFVFVMR
jgi:hypothetical protein